MAERESNGRFAKGNSGGPGNPFAAQVAKLRAVVLACLDAETMRVVVQAMIRQAMRGDVAAAKLLFQYALGKPIEVPLPEEEGEEPEEEADSKREETVSEVQPGTVSKREETEGGERGRTVNKRMETERSPTERDDGAEENEEVERVLRALVELWAEDTGRTKARPSPAMGASKTVDRQRRSGEKVAASGG